MDNIVLFGALLTTRPGKIGCSKFTCYIYHDKMLVEKKEIVKVLKENFSIAAISLMDTTSRGSRRFQTEVVQSDLSFKVDILVNSQRSQGHKTASTCRGRTVRQTLVPLMEAFVWLGNLFFAPLSCYYITNHRIFTTGSLDVSLSKCGGGNINEQAYLAEMKDLVEGRVSSAHVLRFSL